MTVAEVRVDVVTTKVTMRNGEWVTETRRLIRRTDGTCTEQKC